MSSRPDRPDVRTPLLLESQGLPMPVGPQKRDHVRSPPFLVASTRHNGWRQADFRQQPIFLRVCHSPWKAIGQTALVYTRGLIVTYLTAFFGLLLLFKLKLGDPHTDWRLLFDFSTITFVLLFVHHITAFSWTFTHLYYPDIDKDNRRWTFVLLRFMSPPVQRAYSRRRFYFSVFYTIVHVFALMNTLIFWTTLIQRQLTRVAVPGFFSNGWFKPFCVINLWGVTSLLAVIEIVFLNSIRRQVPVAGHVLAVILALMSYLGYAAFGRMLTGHWAYFWMDPEAVGKREIVAAYCSGFVSLGPTVFFLMYGLIGVREKVTGGDEDGEPLFSPSGFSNAGVDAPQEEFEEQGHQREDFQRVNPRT